MWYCAPFKNYYPHCNNPLVKAALERIDQKMMGAKDFKECGELYEQLGQDPDVIFLNKTLGSNEMSVISYPIERICRNFTHRLLNNNILKHQLVVNSDLTLLFHEIKHEFIAFERELKRCDEYDLINEVYSTNKIFVATTTAIVLLYLTNLYKEYINLVTTLIDKTNITFLQFTTEDIERIARFIQEQTGEKFPELLKNEGFLYLYQFMAMFAFKTMQAATFKKTLDAAMTMLENIERTDLQIFYYDGFELYADMKELFHELTKAFKDSMLLQNKDHYQGELKASMQGYTYEEMVELKAKIKS